MSEYTKIVVFVDDDGHERLLMHTRDGNVRTSRPVEHADFEMNAKAWCDHHDVELIDERSITPIHRARIRHEAALYELEVNR